MGRNVIAMLALLVAAGCAFVLILDLAPLPGWVAYVLLALAFALFFEKAPAG